MQPDAHLQDEAGNRNHGQAAVVDLPGAHELVLLRVCGLEVEWVEAQVAHLVVILERVEASAGWGGPANVHAVRLSQTDADEEGLPEALANLGEVGDGWACARAQRRQGIKG